MLGMHAIWYQVQSNLSSKCTTSHVQATDAAVVVKRSLLQIFTGLNERRMSELGTSWRRHLQNIRHHNEAIGERIAATAGHAVCHGWNHCSEKFL